MWLGGFRLWAWGLSFFLSFFACCLPPWHLLLTPASIFPAPGASCGLRPPMSSRPLPNCPVNSINSRTFFPAQLKPQVPWEARLLEQVLFLAQRPRTSVLLLPQSLQHQCLELSGFKSDLWIRSKMSREGVDINAAPQHGTTDPTDSLKTCFPSACYHQDAAVRNYDTKATLLLVQNLARESRFQHEGC